MLETRVRVRPPPPGFDVELRPPGSKSLTNRALLLAGLARGRSRLSGCLESEDTVLMRAALTRLGVRCDVRDEGRELELEGLGGAPRSLAGADAIEVGTAGTTSRFLTAVLAASPLRARLDGSARMRERPMATLIDALREQGAAITCEGQPGFLPIAIDGRAGLRGGELRLSRPASSQFISALIIAAGLARAPTRIVLERGTPARPYVDMTLACVAAFGGRSEWRSGQVDTIAIEPSALVGQDMTIEPDASSASYFLALAAIHGGRVTIPALGGASLQGDAGFAHLLGRMGAEVEQRATQTTVTGTGALRGGEFDLSDMPDMTLTLAVCALYAEGVTRITGVEVLRHHESDRLAAGAAELRKLGATVEERAGGLTITPPAGGRASLRPAVIDTYRDHRMAMAFSLGGHVEIRDPACVGKTFPGYFDVLAGLDMVAA
ncbi:MAG: 3-phosphoshikimate 1-carboxyvinyltransferase [Myxococcales bacterium]|nr:3-phosphoshikimate 1-carboxyvinyltransferase [Myxococcales bacterium]